MATAGAVYLAHAWAFGGGKIGVTALKIAAAKTALPFGQALLLGVLCNALVCLAVWLCFSARSTSDKILSILFPITAFVAMGFEHSIANMYFIPMGLFLAAEPSVVTASGLTSAQLAPLTWGGYVMNLIPVTIGNMIGGGVMVAAVYWFVYLKPCALPPKK
jgi:formate/nitrite transporter